MFDRELRASYQPTLTCWDLGEPSLTSRQLIPVRITDQNDVTPAFGRKRYDVTVAENNLVGAAIIQVR